MINIKENSFYSHDELAEGLNTGRTTIHQFVATKGLKKIKLGKRVYIKGSDFLEWSEKQRGEQ